MMKWCDKNLLDKLMIFFPTFFTSYFCEGEKGYVHNKILMRYDTETLLIIRHYGPEFQHDDISRVMLLGARTARLGGRCAALDYVFESISKASWLVVSEGGCEDLMDYIAQL